MPESSELSSRGRTGPLTDGPVLPPHPEDPVGENPCPVGHPAHRIWEDATREALRDSFRLQERMLEKRPGSADFRGWFIELAFGKFQIWAKRNISIVRTDAAARSYEQWLESFMQSWLKLAEEKYPVELGTESLLPELKLQLQRASKYWSANALESVSAIRNRTDETVPHSEPAKKEGEPGGAAINLQQHPVARAEPARPQRSDASHPPRGVPGELELTEVQKSQIAQIERQLADSFSAHEQMRELVGPSEWVSVGPLRPGAPTMPDEVQKLERDAKEYAVRLVRILAEALQNSATVDMFGERLKGYARDICERVVARIDRRDLPSFDQSDLEAAISREVESWIRKARLESPAPWMPKIGTAPANRAEQPASPDALVDFSSVAGMGAMAHLPSWKDLQADFQQYAGEHADLSAVWRWMHEHLDATAELSAPKGNWTLESRSPGSQHLFRVIAARAASRLQDPSETESWQLWLDRLRAENYARKVEPRRLTMQQIRNLGRLGEILDPVPPGYENQHIPQVFKASADFCFVRSLQTDAPSASQVATKPGLESGAPVGNGSTVRSPGEAKTEVSSTLVIGAERVPVTVESSGVGHQLANPSPDFTSEEKRNRAMAAYTVAWDCSEASLARTATVDPADLSKWKKGSLPGGSDKKARIENALRNNDAPTLLAKRSADE